MLGQFNRVRLCATPWTAAHQAPPSVGFSRQEHWSGVPLPSPFSGREGGTCVIAKLLQSCLTLCTTGTVSHQAPLSMGFSRQEYWSGLPCLPPGDISDPGIEPASLRVNLNWQVGSLPLAPPEKPIYYL